MPEHYVIHFGPHKTGSTYLQWALSLAHAALLDRGILYPVDCGSLQGHHPIVTLLQNGDADAVRAHLDRFAATGAHTVVISSEDLVRLEAEQLIQLRDMLRPAAITTVFYCRRPSEVILSSWRELVKHGITHGLSEHVVRCLTGASESRSVNLAAQITRITRVFGEGSLRLIPYNTVIDEDQNLFTHFCATILGWPDAPLPELRHVNRSVGALDAEIIRVLNVMEQRRAGPNTPSLFKRLIAHRDKVDHFAVSEVMGQYVRSFPIDESKPPFSGWHRAAYERFHGALVGARDRSCLFRPRTTKLPYVHSDYLLEPRIPDRLRALQSQLLALPEPDPLQFTLHHL